jgi:succinyl-CoA synthetase beta subunit
LIGSSKGGVNIEEVAATDPDAIITLPVDINKGVTIADAAMLAKKMRFHDDCQTQAAEMIKNLYDLFASSLLHGLQVGN